MDESKPFSVQMLEAFILPHYCTSGTPDSLQLRTSADIAMMIEEFASVNVNDISLWMIDQGFETTMIDSTPMWKMYLK